MYLPSWNCSLCGKGIFSKKLFETRDIVTGDIFDIFECDFCSVRQIHPIPDDLSRYYKNELGNAMIQCPGKIYTFFKNILLEHEASRILKNLDSKEFLDVGCGYGDFSKILRMKGCRVVAIDSQKSTPPLIKNTDIPYYTIDYETYEIANYGGMKNGVAILRHVLEHIKKPVAFINEMMKCGARSFYIVVPNSASLKMKLLGTYNCHLDPPRHIWQFNKKSLKMFFDKLNLTVIDFGYYTIPTLVPSLYRYLRIRKAQEWIYMYFEPKGMISALSLPLDLLLPHDVIWFILKK